MTRKHTMTQIPFSTPTTTTIIILAYKRVVLYDFFILVSAMAEERPPSPALSFYSGTTETNGNGWFAYEGAPPMPVAAEAPRSVDDDEHAEPDSTSSSNADPLEVVDDDEFSGPADSTSWWNYEDDADGGPADSTTS